MDRIDRLAEQLEQICPRVELLRDEPLSRHTTFRIGGPARLMAVPPAAGQLQKVLVLCRRWEITPIVLGNGSNVLAPDEGVNGLVIQLSGLNGLARMGDTTLLCDSGVPLARLALFAQQNGLTGLEFAHGIPGTLGGGVFMNAGAYGGELKDVVTESRCLTMDGEEQSLRGTEQQFSYRHSAYSSGGKIVIFAQLELKKGEPEEIRAKMAELAARRREKQPLEYPSAGSTFKRPEGHFAAALIEQSGLKGYTIGGAQVSEKHAGFLVNRGGATCSDVLRLVEHVRETVRQRTGVELELEVRVLKDTESK